MKVVCIGDSLTFGYGVRKNKCWVSILNSTEKYEVINKGVNGDTSVGILSRFFKDVVSHSPVACTIMCGSNDLLIGKNVDNIVDNIDLMIKDCALKNIVPIVISPPKVLSELASLLWSNDINYDIVNSKLQALDEKLSYLCSKNNLNFVSLNNLLPLENIYYTDGLHLSESGNEYVYKIIKEKLAN